MLRRLTDEMFRFAQHDTKALAPLIVISSRRSLVVRRALQGCSEAVYQVAPRLVDRCRSLSMK
jgi:hypothetical protein